MKAFLVVCLFACAYAANEDATAEILRSSSDMSPEGNFQYSYETGNGISSQASGQVKPGSGKEEATLEIQGSSQYKSPEGEVIQLTYVANELGYQPQGAHLPTPPAPQEIPEYIVRSLKYIEEHPYQEKKL